MCRSKAWFSVTHHLFCTLPLANSHYQSLSNYLLEMLSSQETLDVGLHLFAEWFLLPFLINWPTRKACPHLRQGGAMRTHIGCVLDTVRG